MFEGGIQDSLDKIFGAIVIGGLTKGTVNYQDKINSYRNCLGRFKIDFVKNIFQDEYAVFYEIIKTLGVSAFSEEQMLSFVDNNRDIVLNSPKVDLSMYDYIDGRVVTDDEKIEVFKSSMVTKFHTFSNTYVMEDEYIASVKMYRDWYTEEYTKETASNSVLIGEIGFQEKVSYNRTKNWIGKDDVWKYISKRKRQLDLLENKGVQGKVIGAEWLETLQDADAQISEDIFSTMGLLTADNHIGSFNKGHMLGVMGAPKAGKTRFTASLVEKYLSEGYNVAVWPLEGSQGEWLSMITALLVRKLYGRSLNSKGILQGKYLDEPETQAMINSARAVLALRGKTTNEYTIASYKETMEKGKHTARGVLSFLDGVGYVEDFIDELQTHFNEVNAFDVLVIDSPVNLQSKDRSAVKSQYLSKAYMDLQTALKKRFRKKVFGIMPAQLKQEWVDKLNIDPDIHIPESAGGETAETIRTPDEVIVLNSSEQMREGGYVDFRHVASRHGSSFPRFAATVDFACCFFVDNGDMVKVSWGGEKKKK